MSSIRQETPSSRAFNPSDILPGGRITSDFERHANRNPPSARPGVDIDVTFPTEGLSPDERPTVKAHSDGTIIVAAFGDDNYGTITILDDGGTEQTSLHMMKLQDKELTVGSRVKKGNDIGLLFNKKTKDDHVHFRLTTSDGRVIDPEQVLFDEKTGQAVATEIPESMLDADVQEAELDEPSMDETDVGIDGGDVREPNGFDDNEPNDVPAREPHNEPGSEDERKPGTKP